MASVIWNVRLTTRVLSRGRPRATRYVAGVVVATASLLGATMPAVAATSPTLGVVIVGSGRVTSQPSGIVCPGKCTATFAVGTSVVLTPQPKNGSTFLGWGGACTGTGVCKVSVSTLTAVAAQFVSGPKPPPTTNKYLAVPGPYSGSNGQMSSTTSITFDVAPGGKSILNVSIPTTSLACPGGGGASDHLGILNVPIRPDGFFTSTTYQAGVASGPSKFTYTFTGRLLAATAKTAANAAGTWREDITFAQNGSTTQTTTCTSNEQSWTATLYREPPWQRSVIKPGNYSGSNGQMSSTTSITFSVAAGGTSMLNVSIPTTSLRCYTNTGGGGGNDDHLGILNVPIRPDGSFTSTTSQVGVFGAGGNSAKFTYTFAGYFEGTTPAGAATVAGTWSEDIVLVGGAVCNSNDQSWTATLQS
jgi:hypothetical protein